MRILFLAPYAPGHVRVRSFQFLHQLLARGHEVHLICPETPAGEEQDRSGELIASGLRVLRTPAPGWARLPRCAAAILRRQPAQACYDWSPELQQRLAAELAAQRYDILHCEHLRATTAVLRLPEAVRARVPVRIWDSVDSVSSLLAQVRAHGSSRSLRAAARIEQAPTRRWERRALGRFTATVVAAPEDRAALAAVSPGRAGTLHVVPNGVDTEEFRPRPELAGTGAELVFSGALDYHANDAAVRELVEKVLPRLWKWRPKLRLLLVGASPSPALRRLLATQGPRVRFTGWVPSVAPYLATAQVAVAPMRYGTGIQNKVLEALACGTPVVTDPRSAAALGARHGEELLVAASAADCAREIQRLLDEPDLRAALARGGRSFVARTHSWDRAGMQLEELYTALTRAGR